MTTLLLLTIYLAFISLGLPDSVLGSAWPVMQIELGVPIETAGLISLVIAGNTIISSLFSGIVIKRLGTGLVTLLSCVMTATSLVGFSFAPSVFWLIMLAVPLGLGGGSVDAGLNSYVAAHYRAHHMNWLHCFWGVGATLGPIIMSFHIANADWRSGYFSIAMLQFVLVVVLLVSLPLWKRAAQANQAMHEQAEQQHGQHAPIGRQGVKYALLAFLFYCGVESAMGLWGSSFLVNIKHLSPADAAGWVSLFYAGITVGRLVSGFISFKVANKVLIRWSQIIVLSGTLLFMLPLPAFISLAGFLIVGLGCAPIFPSMIHETPVRFGQEQSQKIIGYQMASAYTGSTLLPPFLGFLAAQTSIIIFPMFVAVCAVLMLICSERINTMMARTLRQSR